MGEYLLEVRGFGWWQGPTPEGCVKVKMKGKLAEGRESKGGNVRRGHPKRRNQTKFLIPPSNLASYTGVTWGDYGHLAHKSQLRSDSRYSHDHLFHADWIVDFM